MSVFQRPTGYCCLGNYVYGENYTKRIHTLWVNIAELAGAIYSYRSAPTVNPDETRMMCTFRLQSLLKHHENVSGLQHFRSAHDTAIQDGRCEVSAWTLLWGMQLLKRRICYIRTWHTVGGRVSYKLHYVSFFTANSRRIRFATSI
jgi:hypothetical protein